MNHVWQPALLLSPGTAGVLAASLVAGLMLGAVHFGLLWWNARLWSTGAVAGSLALQAARFALVVAGLAALVHVGAGALLAGAAGLFLARALVVRRIGGRP